MADKAPDEVPKASTPHPDAVKAREIQDAVDSILEMAREAHKRGLNPELAEDYYWTVAKLRQRLNRIFGIGE